METNYNSLQQLVAVAVAVVAAVTDDNACLVACLLENTYYSVVVTAAK